jgi:hypothetical protein
MNKLIRLPHCVSDRSATFFIYDLLFLALTAVTVQTVRAATADPVNSLKSD